MAVQREYIYDCHCPTTIPSEFSLVGTPVGCRRKRDDEIERERVGENRVARPSVVVVVPENRHN